VSEAELQQHYAHIVGIFDDCRAYGFQTAIDDFGTGYAGLSMLAEYQPNYIKLDRHLIAGIDTHHVKQTIVKGVRGICRQLGIGIVAEGVETLGEYHWLRRAGIRLFQGYYFARPAFEALADVRHGLF
jgi:EAL domain-containing protein (putative c-di-GMP-specific phosphodiesterase class I)